MRASLIVPIAALVVFPARAEDGQADGSGIAIAVFMQFDEQYSAVSLAAMQQELESIMSACSLNIQWRVLDGSASRESFSDLVAGRLRLGPKQSEEIRRSLRQSRIPAGRLGP